ncbi:MAG: protein kinase [Chloroflexota bacterium]|nr:protein kinase [Chloroflexota bacterium]
MTQTVSPPFIVGKRYQLLAEIGSGNMGTVHRAVDRLTGRTVALKLVKISPDRLRYGSYSAEGDPRLMLAREFRILSSLRHPHIISVLDYGFDDVHGNRQPYITMELLENAHTLTDNAHHLTVEQKIDLLAQILQALMYLHRRGILHRDLKPANVLVIDGQVKVLDFGLSITNEQASREELAGTPGYMAPELWIGNPASKRSDLYALGVIAYRLFAGQHPFDLSDLRILYNQVTKMQPDWSVLGVEAGIAAIVERLMSKDQFERYDEAGEVIQALRDVTGQALSVETAATRESFLQAAAFVGRQKEMRALLEKLGEALDGQGSAWLIGGESGVGKSRLTDELRTRALVNGFLVLRGAGADDSRPLFYLLRDALAWLTLIAEPDDRDAAVLKTIVPEIAQLLGREIPDPPIVSPQAAQARLLVTVEALFRGMCAGATPQPMLVLLEDLHWADTESLMILDRLTRVVTGLPIFIIGTYRDDENPNLPALLPSATVIHLDRLDEREIAMLIEGMLGDVGRNPELLRLIRTETEGNAFFLVETLRALAEEAGGLDDIGSKPLPMHVLTGGVQGIVQRRLSRVPENARLLLRCAAVIGRTLDLEVLHEMLKSFGKESKMDYWLSDCADAAVLEVQDGQWRFGHSKLRDGTLAEIDAETLKDLNRRAAVAIASVYEYSSRRTAEALAFHWRMAGDPEKEEHYAALAGEQALRAGGYDVAKTFLQRALELQDCVETTKRKKANLKTLLGDTMLALSQRDTAMVLYEEALALCRDASYRWGVASNLSRMGQAISETGEFERAANYMIEGLKTAMDSRAIIVALSTLTAMAQLLAKAGSKVAALEYATLVMHHPSTDGQTGETADKLIQQLRAELPPAEAAAAIESGMKSELKEIVNKILSESAQV